MKKVILSALVVFTLGVFLLPKTNVLAAVTRLLNARDFTLITVTAPADAKVISLKATVVESWGATSVYETKPVNSNSNTLSQEVPLNSTANVEACIKWTNGRTPECRTWLAVNFTNPNNNTVSWTSNNRIFPAIHTQGKTPVMLAGDEHIIVIPGLNTVPVLFKYYLEDGRVGTISNMSNLPFDSGIRDEGTIRYPYYYFDMDFQEPRAMPSQISKYVLTVKQSDGKTYTYTYYQDADGIYVRNPLSSNVFTDYTMHFDSYLPVYERGSLYSVSWDMYNRLIPYGNSLPIIKSYSMTINLRGKNLDADMRYKIYNTGDNFFVYNPAKADLRVAEISRNKPYYKIKFCNYGTDTDTAKFVLSLQNTTSGKTYTTPEMYPYTVPAVGACAWTGGITCGLIGDSTCSADILVTATVDATNNVPETNEKNNMRSRDF